LNIEIPSREINTRDPRSTAQAIFRRWLPLPDALLRMVVRAMPSPTQSQKNRIDNLIVNPSLTNTAITIPEWRCPILEKMKKVYNDIEDCKIDEKETDVTVFISKMTPIRAGDLSSKDMSMIRDKKLSVVSSGDNMPLDPIEVIDSSTEIFMALGRVFSGVLSRDTDLFILGNRHDPMILDETAVDQLNQVNTLELVSEQYANDKVYSNVGETTITSVKRLPAGSFGLYICLGPSAYPVDKVYAGNIVGIIGLEEHVFKSGTLCSTWATLPMKAITFQAKPMVRVALEPLSHFDLPKLEKGLRSLYQYDPVVEVGVDDSGQHTMTCLGELHLELCLKTLIDKFAK
jgi:ribosome assembly protein 1